MLITLCTVTTLRVAASLEASSVPLDIQPARLRALSKQAEAALEQVNDRRARRGIPEALQAEDDRQAKVIEEMIEVIQEVVDKDSSDEKVTATAWGESQARNEVLQIARGSVEAAQSEEGRAEKFRVEATQSTQAAIASAARMVQVAKEAQAVADHLRKQKVADVIKSVEEENEVALSQADLSIKMGLMAKQIIQAANTLARSTLMRAKVAETEATEALETARRNTGRIAAVKTRMAKAHQMAKAAQIH